MPTEITCEQCSEQFEVGDLGLAVCPACGHAANLPAEPVEPVDSADEDPAADATVNLNADQQTGAEEATLIGGFDEDNFDPESALTEALDADDLPNFGGMDDSPTMQDADVPDFLGQQDRSASSDDSETRFEPRDETVAPESSAEDRDAEPTVMMNQATAPPAEAATVVTTDQPSAAGTQPNPGTASTLNPPTASAAQPSGPTGAEISAGGPASPSTRPHVENASGVSSGMFVAVASYASAVTLALLYLLFFARSDPHQLESLPDLEPLSEEEFQIIPAEAAVAPGHRLQLGSGEGTRFGNIRVRPLRVSRGPVEYDYFMESSTAPTRKPSAPVLKLWVEFTNDSKDQVFTPLDGRLLSREHVRESDFQRFANNFLRPAGEEVDAEQLVFTLGHSPTDPFNIRDQNLGKRLQPGESCVMFVPSDEEGLSQLDGDLVWRLQLRKGFHPKTRHGVTTLIEVEFSTADVEEETPGDGTADTATETT